MTIEWNGTTHHVLKIDKYGNMHLACGRWLWGNATRRDREAKVEAPTCLWCAAS